MSLHEAMLEIAEQMESEADRPGECGVGVCWGEDAQWQFRSFAKQIRSAVKAAGNPPVPLLGFQNEAMITKARQEFRLKNQQEGEVRDVQGAVSGGEKMLEVLGGSSDGVMFPGPAETREGMKTMIGDEVYIIREGQLRFSEVDTTALRSKEK